MKDNYVIVRSNEIGQRLKRLKLEKGITNSEIARELSVSQQAVYKWTSGQSTPDIQNICNLSTLLSTTTDYILKGESRDFENRLIRIVSYALLLRMR